MSILYIFMRLNRFSPLLFALAGTGFFFFHFLNIQEKISLIFIGPVIYLMSFLYKLLNQYLSLNISGNALLYAFLLPGCIVYFGILGFLIKQIMEEKGFIKFLTVFAISGFFIFIHFLAWKNLGNLLATAPELLPT